MNVKIKSTLEVLAGATLIFGYIWCINPMDKLWIHGVFIALVLGLLIYSKNSHKESWRDLGFRLDTFIVSGAWVFAVTAIILLALLMIWQLKFPVDKYFFRQKSFWIKLLEYPLWAILQQYIALAFFFTRLREIFFPRLFPAVIFSAVFFSAAHIPTPLLMIFCFLGCLFWAWIYNLYPNILTIALSHAILGIFCSNILLMYTLVGPHADWFRWTKESPILYSLDTVNGVVPAHSGIRVFEVKGSKSVVLTGWVTGRTEDVEQVLIRIDGKDYQADYGKERRDVSAYYNNPNYKYCGFYAIIPSAGISPGIHELTLKVMLKHRPFWYARKQGVWVKII